MASTHYITPAEEKIMAAVDNYIDTLSVNDHHKVLIDVDFLRDYIVTKLQLKYKQLGIRAFTAHACASVCMSRYYYTRRDLIHFSYKKNTNGAVSPHFFSRV